MNGEITRRNLLLTGAGALTLAALDWHGTSEMAAASPLPILAENTSAWVNYFDASFAHQIQLEFPLLIAIQDFERSLMGAVIEFQFDSRFFTAAESVRLSQDGRLWPIPVAVSADLANRSTARFTVEKPLKHAEPLTILPPLVRQHLYPNENISDAYPVSMTVTYPTQKSPAKFDWQQVVGSTVVAPWGVFLACGWSQFRINDSRQDRQYRYPEIIRLESTGPCSVPSNSTISIDLDSRLIRSYVISGMTLNGVKLNEFPMQSDSSFMSAGLLRVELGIGSTLR